MYVLEKLNLVDLLTRDYKPVGEITEKVKKENGKRVFTGGVRINNSMYRTSKEDAEYRRKSLARRLP